MAPLNAEQIAWAAQIACLLEVSAEKPGNVTRSKDFWDTHLAHFLASSVALGSAMRTARAVSVGSLIFSAVSNTRQLVSTNTNLGMVLLLAPLASAAAVAEEGELRQSLSGVLASLTRDDARLAYEAIRLAVPAGMGTVESHDIRETERDVAITLREAMRLAEGRDAVAREYVTDYRITFEIGYASLRGLWDQGYRFSQIIVQTFLTILAQVPDTLIRRKSGQDVALQVSRRAQEILAMGGAIGTVGLAELQRFDQDLRDERHFLNPGTTADLTSASLFVFLTDGGKLRELPDLLARW